jgi:hypothetical protein
MYYTFFFNVDAVVCQNNGQFQVWELNISQFIVIVEVKYFLNLKDIQDIKSPKTFRVSHH